MSNRNAIYVFRFYSELKLFQTHNSEIYFEMLSLCDISQVILMVDSESENKASPSKNSQQIQLWKLFFTYFRLEFVESSTNEMNNLG